LKIRTGIEVGVKGVFGVRVEIGIIGTIVVVEVRVNKVIFKAENINCSRSWSESDKGSRYRSWIANACESRSKGRYRSWSQDCRWRRNWSVNRSISRSKIK
jgi:hypothetical protein